MPDDREFDRDAAALLRVDPAMQPRERATRLESGAYKKQVRSPIDGRRISITCPTESECLQKAEIVRQWRRDLEFGLISTEEVAQKLRLLTAEERAADRVRSLKAIWEEYVASFSPSRQRSLAGTWSRHFRKRFDKKTALDVSPKEDLEEWEKDEGKAGSAKTYIKLLFAQLRAAVNREVAAGAIASYPWQRWKPTGKYGQDTDKREPLRSIEEVELLLRAARAHDDRLRSWGYYSDAFARVATLFFAALRQGEGAALGNDHIYLVQTPEGPRMNVFVEYASRDGWRSDRPDWTRPKYPPKSGNSKRDMARTLRAHPTLQAILLEHRQYLEAWDLYRPDGPVFPVPPKKGRVPGDTAPLWRNEEWVLKPERLREFARAAGVEMDLSLFDCHSLRHTFVTLELAATNNPIATSQRSGHRDLKIFFQYAHKVGRGLPESPLRALRLEPPASSFPVLPAELSALPAPAPIETITRARANDITELREGAADIATIVGPAEDEDDYTEKLALFERAFLRWSNGGRVTKYPKEVTERLNEAYSRAYNAAIRLKKRGETEEQRKERARQKGFFAKRAVQGAWGRILKRMGDDAAPELDAEGEPVRTERDRERYEDRDDDREAERGDLLLASGDGGGRLLPFRRVR